MLRVANWIPSPVLQRYALPVWRVDVDASRLQTATDKLQRPDFATVTARVWHVIAAHDFKDINTAQHVCRTEARSDSDKIAADRLAGE